MLATVAATGALVVAFEDLHWAEPTMLELIEHLAATPAPVLVLCTTRDEVSGEGDGWAATAGGTVIELDRLSPDEAAELAAGIAGTAVSPADAAGDRRGGGRKPALPGADAGDAAGRARR